MFSQDFKELLSAFAEHRVKYLIVGGYAVAVHAQPRATKDLDLFVQPELENAKAILRGFIGIRSAARRSETGGFDRSRIVLSHGCCAAYD